MTTPSHALLAPNQPKRKRPPWEKPKPARRRPERPSLRFTPYAWAKLLYLRDAGPTEIGGFGISLPGEPLLIDDVQLVRQACDWSSVQFDDASVADYFDREVDLGRTPEEFGRVWVHTHPGASAEPSATDEETFLRVFGSCDWAVMFILARSGASYARLTFGVGPGGSCDVPVEIAFETPFLAADHASWQAEYAECVQQPTSSMEIGGTSFGLDEPLEPWLHEAWRRDYYGGTCDDRND